uniref:Uncharacterized protein n=1 Tax=Heliothis virescens TaxID=7102 RepID=A0A2A4K3U4_HELVI
MLSSTVSLAAHLYSSLQGVQSIGRALGYILPYSNMAAVKVKKNFNTKHLTKGDPLPPFSGKLRVYNMRYCPYAQRTMFALIAKGIDYDLVNIDLVDKPEWITSVSAFGKVPALEIADGVSIYESLVTVEYLDEVYPQRPLLPKDPLLRAKEKIIVQAFDGVNALFFKLMRTPDAVTEQNLSTYYNTLSFIQEELKQRGTTFLGGEEPGYADYMIWPWFERLLAVKSDIGKIDKEKYKLLWAYLEKMLADPVVAEYAVPDEIFLEFRSAYLKGTKPNYDLLLED